MCPGTETALCSPAPQPFPHGPGLRLAGLSQNCISIGVLESTCYLLQKTCLRGFVFLEGEDFIHSFLDRREGREIEREKHWLVACTTLPDRVLNLQARPAS